MMRQFVSSLIHSRQSLARLFGSAGPVPHIAVVGSGPAGFYTAQQLLKVSTN